MASSGLAMSGVTLMDAACSELATLQQQTGFGGLDQVGEQTGLGGAIEQAAIGGRLNSKFYLLCSSDGSKQRSSAAVNRRLSRPFRGLPGLSVSKFCDSWTRLM